VRELIKGRPLLGTTRNDFNVEPSGSRKVTMVITVRPPRQNAKPTGMKYEFEVR
jgi:hypothetical protein